MPEPGRYAGKPRLYLLQRRGIRRFRRRPHSLCRRTDRTRQVPGSEEILRQFIYRLFPGIYEYLCAGFTSQEVIYRSHLPSGYSYSGYRNKTGLSRIRYPAFTDGTGSDQAGMDRIGAADHTSAKCRFHPEGILPPCIRAFTSSSGFRAKIWNRCSLLSDI